MVFNLLSLQMSEFGSLLGLFGRVLSPSVQLRAPAHSHSRNPEFSGAQFSINCLRLLRKRAGTGLYNARVLGPRYVFIPVLAAAAACKCHAAPQC